MSAARRVSTQALGELTDMADQLSAAAGCCVAKVRIEILSQLACGPMSVGELARALDLDHTLVSKYLKVLTAGGITQMQRIKTTHRFSLGPRVSMRTTAQAIELHVPVQDGLYLTLGLNRRIVQQLRPEVTVRTGPAPEPCHSNPSKGQSLTMLARPAPQEHHHLSGSTRRSSRSAAG